ncbi:MAG TPA: hybrid sensor histidine kinase/response regulator [Verrucomicrobiales bacterium]|nr:hybrid sensor histidine kinase/response regulator [Verrucomicrobiales bacterium]
MPATTSFSAPLSARVLPPVRQNGAPDPSCRTLLVVDDEEGPRQSLRVIFKDDYRLLVAHDAESALRMAEEEMIDAAILDIRMEGMNGVELLSRLKKIDPGIEVVMLTAYETIDTIRQALRFGACDYLNKPFDIGQIRAAVANAMERRALHLAIRSNNHRLGELQEELQNQKLQEEIIRTRGDIYASVIHDINGPLTIISGFIQIINRRIGDTQQVEGESLDLVKDRLTRITRQVTNCIDISRRYLSFLRQEPGERSQVGINQILSDLSELLKVHPSVKNNRLSIQELPEDLTVEINGTDLIQILLNLTINALQATGEPHEVEIDGAFLREPVDIAPLNDGPNDRVINRDEFRNCNHLLELSVRDSGPGIPEETMARLFVPYFTTKAEGQGTGLGLTIVKRLIVEAGGMVHLRSEVGSGTRFTIYLPAWLRQ